MVRDHWVRQNALAILKGAWASVTTTGLSAQRLSIKLSWPMTVTVFGPLFVVLGTAAVLILTTVFLILALSGVAILGVAGLLTAFAAAIVLFKLMAGFNAPWIGRITLFIDNGSRKAFLSDWDGPDEMADAILRALRDPENDEVLVVSHSVGVLIALLAFERALEKSWKSVDRAASDGRLVFVTLGQSIPLMSGISADFLRALKSVGDSKVIWLDISSPTDPACFAMVDSYCEHFGGPQRMHVKNAQLYKNFSNPTYQMARRNRFVMHFMYLMAPDGDGPASFDLYESLSSGTRLSDRLPTVPESRHPYYNKRSKP